MPKITKTLDIATTAIMLTWQTKENQAEDSTDRYINKGKVGYRVEDTGHQIFDGTSFIKSAARLLLSWCFLGMALAVLVFVSAWVTVAARP